MVSSGLGHNRQLHPVVINGFSAGFERLREKHIVGCFLLQYWSKLLEVQCAFNVWKQVHKMCKLRLFFTHLSQHMNETHIANNVNN